MMQAGAHIDGQLKDVTIFVGRRKQDQAPKCMDPNTLWKAPGCSPAAASGRAPAPWCGRCAATPGASPRPCLAGPALRCPQLRTDPPAGQSHRWRLALQRLLILLLLLLSLPQLSAPLLLVLQAPLRLLLPLARGIGPVSRARVRR